MREQERRRLSDPDFAQLKRERRFVTIDLEAADLNPDRGDFESQLQAWLEETSKSKVAAAPRALWKTILAEAGKRFTWSPPSVPARSVSLKPATDEHLRHATRVIAMVHELHKAGYQRIRATPALNASGSHWRCYITSVDNVMEDGFTPRKLSFDDGTVASYSTSQGNRFFDWADAGGADARNLARLFLDRFPFVADRGAGRDWMYAGWLTDLLGRFEQGGEDAWLYLMADFPIDPDVLDHWRPPPPPM
jgi:hypothetical protein